MFRKLWNDDAGVVALEYLFLCVIVGLGMAVGYTALSEALNCEYVELGQAILALDDGYYVTTQATGGFIAWESVKNGTDVRDTPGVLFWGRCAIPAFCPSPFGVFASP